MKRLMLATIGSSIALSGFAFGAALPPEIQVGNLQYVSGGIGENEADSMRRAAPSYPLELMFSQSKAGNFIADVDLRIQAHDGLPLLMTTTAGPIVLARLPQGRYRVEARFDGRTLRRDVEIDPAQHKILYLNWPV